ncbi:MAG: redoxin domain-containing protein [Anaerolineae bacterium]
MLGISPDSVELLRQWKTQKKLPYDLLSDPDHHVLEAWGAWGISIMGVIRVPMVNRSMWVIDEAGMVVERQINVSPKDSVRRALAAVGEVEQLG